MLSEVTVDEILRYCEKKLHCEKHELDAYSDLLEELLHVPLLLIGSA